MKTNKFIASALALVAVVACTSKNAEEGSDAEALENAVKAEQPVNPKALLPKKALVDSASYYLGLNFGMTLKQYNFGDVNYSLVMKGMKDFANSKGEPTDSTFNDQFKYNPGERFGALYETVNEYLRQRHEYTLALNAEKEVKFLAEQAKKPGVQITESGIQYIIEEAGSEVKPGQRDTVFVLYKGTRPDGTVFDQTAEGAEPIRMLMNRVIPGWTEGLQLIGEGGKIHLVIPSELAYGERGNNGIEPNTPLTFDIELVEVKPYVEPAEPVKK